MAGDAAQQVQLALVRAVPRLNYGKGGGSETAGVLTTPEATPRSYYIPSRQPHASWSSPISGRLLAEAGWGMYQARYRFTKRNDGTDVPGMIQVLEQGGEVPNLLSRAPQAPANRWIRALADRDPGEPAGVADVCDRRAQHEVRVPGRVRQSLPDLQLPEPDHADPDERRRAEPADADHRGRGPASSTSAISFRPTSTRRTSGRIEPADAAGRHPVRLAGLQLSRLAHRRPRLSVRTGGDLLSEPVDTRVRLEGHLASSRRGVRPVREREDGGPVQHGQVHGSHHGDQQRSGHEPADSHGRPDDTRVDRHEPELRAGLRPR